MLVDLDTESLIHLVMGSYPPYNIFNHPLVIKAGYRYNEQFGGSYNSLSLLSDEELYELHKICKRNK